MATKARHLKTPVQLWVADNRKAMGLEPRDLAEWTGVTEDTARGWESRGRPSEDALAILERRFGKPAPRTSEPGPSGDVAGLFDALTKALEAQTGYLTQIADLRAEVADNRRTAAKERDQVARLLGHMSDQLDELRDLVRTQVAPEPPDRQGHHN